MQQILYEENVFVVWGYADALEAYRSDVIESMQPQPDPGGNYYGQDGYWSWWSAVPASADDSSGTNPGIVIGIVVAGLVVLGGGGFLLLRRRAATAEDRE
jgi:peptide/nickel transport system substrate-binding protein